MHSCFFDGYRSLKRFACFVRGGILPLLLVSAITSLSDLKISTKLSSDFTLWAPTNWLLMFRFLRFRPHLGRFRASAEIVHVFKKFFGFCLPRSSTTTWSADVTVLPCVATRSIFVIHPRFFNTSSDFTSSCLLKVSVPRLNEQGDIPHLLLLRCFVVIIRTCAAERRWVHRNSVIMMKLSWFNDSF